MITGCDAGVINVWDIETSLITKVCIFCTVRVLCARIDQKTLSLFVTQTHVTFNLHLSI